MSQTILAFDVNIAGVGSQLMPVAPPSRVESAVEVCTIVTIFGLHDCHYFLHDCHYFRFVRLSLFLLCKIVTDFVLCECHYFWFARLSLFFLHDCHYFRFGRCINWITNRFICTIRHWRGKRITKQGGQRIICPKLHINYTRPVPLLYPW